MNESRYPYHKIVVGVDGSDSSKDALRWAVRQAELTESRVEAVIAWTYPVMVGGFGFGPVSAMVLDFKDIATSTLAHSLAEVVGEASPVKVSSTVAEGHPVDVLLRACKDADLLVVGCRGYGGFTEALLGSVSQHCVHHATCPVVIVRDHVAR